MDWLNNLFTGGRFLGIEWNTWKVIGWLGNAVFFSRFFLQWYATEKRKQVVVPPAFWWLSLGGSGLLLSYALFYRSGMLPFTGHGRAGTNIQSHSLGNVDCHSPIAFRSLQLGASNFSLILLFARVFQYV